MKTKLFSSLALLLAAMAVSVSCGGEAPVITGSGTTAASAISAVTTAKTEETTIDTESIHIHSFDELNTSVTVDSHADECADADIELDFRSKTRLKSAVLGTALAYYPRIKKIAEDNYILFYNDGQTGPDVYICRSTDLVTWSKPEKFLASYTQADGDTVMYATCDAAVMADGSIIAVACYRSKKYYTSDPSKSGLVKRISRDGGQTWDDAEIIYVGTSWEPCALVLDSGELQVYFTQIAPGMYYYGYNNTIRSSGSAIIRSYDNGLSFTPDVKGAPYRAYTVMQTYVGLLNNNRIYNDQMPVAIQLNNGGIVLACETKTISGSFSISIGYSGDNWAEELDFSEAGPADKSTNAFRGAGPYLAQFPSGETLLSYATGSNYNIKIGNSDGRSFSADNITPFGTDASGNMWGSLEILGNNTVLASAENILSTADGTKISMLVYGKLRLNHRINAAAMAVTVDGDSGEWESNTDALFVGSVGQAQASLRAANDGDRLCFLAEVLDRYVSESADGISVFVSGDGKSFCRVSINADGKVTAVKYNGTGFDSMKTNITCAARISDGGSAGTYGAGYVIEFALSKSDFGITGDSLYVDLVLRNTDNGAKSDNDTFTGSLIDDISTWQKIVLD